jgi:hypothetical protein
MSFRQAFVALASVLPALAACSSTSTDPTAAENDLALTADDVAASASCPTKKLAFTKATGCDNDGSVEFCVSAADEALQAKIRAIAPSVEFATVGMGRAKCDMTRELRASFPTRPNVRTECTSSGHLTNHAWAEICTIAKEPEIRKIVPTFFE